MASTMIETSSTMPTAVITESSENTMSMIAICTMTAAKPARTAAAACSSSSSPSSEPWISCTLFHSRKRPPPMRMRSRPEMSLPDDGEQRLGQRMTHASESSSPMRVSIANARPSVRARWRCCSGSRPTSIEMKTMLSTPSTISSAVSVTSAIQAGDRTAIDQIFDELAVVGQEVERSIRIGSG